MTTTNNIREIIRILVEKSEMDTTEAYLSVYDLLPRTIQREYAEERVASALESNNIEGLNMTQLRQFAKRKGFRGYSTYKLDELYTFCDSGGDQRPEGSTTQDSPARIVLEEKKTRRQLIIDASKPGGISTFGTEAWKTQDLDVLTVSNLKTIAKLDKEFMMGKRADMMGMKRDDLLEKMQAYIADDAEVDAEDAIHIGTKVMYHDNHNNEVFGAQITSINRLSSGLTSYDIRIDDVDAVEEGISRSDFVLSSFVTPPRKKGKKKR
jgi:hypothetical protein